MAKDQSNDITEQVGDTPETVVEKTETMQPVTQTIVKKTSTTLSLLAILIALGMGGAGYYFGQQQVAEIQQKLTALESQSGVAVSVPVSDNSGQVTQLEQGLKTAQDKVEQLEQLVAGTTCEVAALQAQVKQVIQLAAA